MEYVYWLPDQNGNRSEIKTIANSIILIGANGSGKSRLGAWIEQQQPDIVHRIGAQRSLNFQDFISMKSYAVSEESVLYNNTTYDDRKQKIYKYGLPQEDRSVTHFFDDFDDVLSALIAKTNIDNERFMNECKKAEARGEHHPHTPETDIDRLQRIWSDIFPHRSIEYDDLRFYAVDSNIEHMNRYSATKMSDGERSALYFIAQVLCVPKERILLIDEPEIHFHKSLMNRLWMALERYRSDCLFIYITHDTQFASNHINADKYWVKGYLGEKKWQIEKVDEQELPEDLLLDLLGNRKKVLFVEGERGSYDAQIYSLIYKDYYVVPCGSCIQVIAKTKAFNNTPLLHYNKAYGIIDRDYRTEYEIEQLRTNNVFTLDVAEVENLFIVEEIVRAIAQKLGLEDDEVFRAVKNYVVRDRFKKQIDAQICQAVVSEIKYKLESIYIDNKSDDKAKETLDKGLNAISFESIKQTIESGFIEVKDSDDYRKVIRVFNEKNLAKSIGQFMSIRNNDYCRVAAGMLRNGLLDAEAILGTYMPSKEDIPR